MNTIKEVAKAAGVSVATVSRVLNREPSVTPETRERVLKVVRETGYTPNAHGRNLRASVSNRILVLLPSLANQFLPGVVRSVERAAQRAGYRVLVCATHADSSAESELLGLLYDRSVDGAILLSSTLPAERLTAVAQSYPLVMCNEYREGAALSYVSVDNRLAARDAVHRLAAAGHRRIAIVSNESYDSARQRTQGYLEEIAASHCVGDAAYIRTAEYDFASGMRACRELMALAHPPTAVFAISDVLAAGVIKQLFYMGLRAGRDVDVIGFDNTGLSKIVTPSISTVAQPKTLLGKTAAELLLEKIADLNSPIRSVCVPHRLVLRETTREKI